MLQNKGTVSKRVLILRTWSLIRTFLAFWVLIYISGSLLSLFWLHSRKECQFSLHVYNNGSGLNCWQILIFTYVYALIFIHRRFRSLYWLLWVLISQKNGSLLSPYLKAWGSLLVLETVLNAPAHQLTLEERRRAGPRIKKRLLALHLPTLLNT